MKIMLSFAAALLAAAISAGCVFSASTNSSAGGPSASPAGQSGGGPAAAKDAPAKPAASPEAAKSIAPPKPKEEEALSAGSKYENRCGWFVNPTPGNAWLVDADGEWIIGTQGGEQADGDWPDFPDSQWVKTNVNYGYGCACMQVAVDKGEMRVLEIKSAKAKPLADCRRDKKLTEPSDE